MKSFKGLITKLDVSQSMMEYGRTPEEVPVENSPVPELIIGAGKALGLLWDVRDGKLRLPLVNGVDPTLDSIDPMPSDAVVRAAMTAIMKRSRWGALAGMEEAVEKDKKEAAAPAGEKSVDPLSRYATLPVAVKLACPTEIARVYRRRETTPSDCSKESIFPYNDHDEKWQAL